MTIMLLRNRGCKWDLNDFYPVKSVRYPRCFADLFMYDSTSVSRNEAEQTLWLTVKTFQRKGEREGSHFGSQCKHQKTKDFSISSVHYSVVACVS